jgi:hypothetical protein
VIAGSEISVFPRSPTLGAASCANDTGEDGAAGSARVDSTSAALTAESCDQPHTDVLWNHQDLAIYAFRKAAQNYDADPSSQWALESFGTPDNGQFGRVHDAFQSMNGIWALEGFSWESHYVCNPTDWCPRDAAGNLLAVANSQNTGTVFICGDYSSPFWGSTDSLGGPTDPFFYLVHEYWHWLGWVDEQNNVEPSFITTLAATRPEVAADNPENYAQFVRNFR